jgi:RNA polymerase sigma factor (sigma-70 family)
MPNEPHTDQQYITALCSGNEALIREIYAKYARGVQIWVTQNNGEVADAQDLFQDALMAVYDRYCGREFVLTSSLGALLMTICRRKWFDRLAQKTREEGVRKWEENRYNEEDSEWEAAEAVIIQQKRQECLSQVFKLLSEQCQKMLTMVAAGAHSVEQIAAELGFANANALYQSKHRCTARWRQLFNEHFKEN